MPNSIYFEPNGDSYYIRIQTDQTHDDPKHAPDGDNHLYRHISISTVDGSTLDGFDYVGPIDL